MVKRFGVFWFLSGVLIFLVLFQGAGIAAEKAWRISGKVLSLSREPLAATTVELETTGAVSGRKTVETNLQGIYQFEITLKKAAQVPYLKATLTVKKNGYLEGRETLHMNPGDVGSGINIILEKPESKDDQLSIATLTSMLAPRLQTAAAKNCSGGIAEFTRGYEALMGEKKAEEALERVAQSASNVPDCVESQLLLGLALLNAGHWGGVMRQLENTDIIAGLLEVKSPEMDLLKGSIEELRGSLSAAAGFYKKVLETEEQDMFALLEMGRIALMTKQWAVADQFVGKALAAGAGDEARLMQIRAMLELGEVISAAEEMESYIAGRNIRNFPVAVRSLHTRLQNQLLLLSGGGIQSVINQPIAEFTEVAPELQGLQPAENQDLLEELLDKVGKGVEAFFRNIPNSSSIEKVRQERLKKDGKVTDALDQEFIYLMLAGNKDEPGMGIEEFRSTKDGHDAEREGRKQGFMLTTGFVSSPTIFHPAARNESTFRYIGTQRMDDRDFHVLAFAQRPETAKMTITFNTDRESALALRQGLAWVDAETFQIRRLHTWLLNPLLRIRLLKLTTEINFKEVLFAGQSTPLLLPETVDIQVDWRGRFLHNRHHYSDYMIFSVNAVDGQKTITSRKTEASDSDK